VVVAADAREAHAAIASAMEDRAFGTAGARVVLEECLSGPEVSFFAICDGRTALPLTSAQDHKRAFDDDRGPNTGGMGAFAPSPLVNAAMYARIMDDIIRPVLRGMRDEGHEYRGFLYAGLMLTCDGPKVIEFNVRLGDPETQVVLPLVDGPLAPALLAAARGDLGRITVPIRDGEVRVGVVLASAGYPGPIETGKPIDGLEVAESMPGVLVFHAGTAIRDNHVVTAGGRVLTVVGGGDTYATAIERAYAAVDRISYEGKQYRRDIGARARVGVRS
jgi:phosphoribosylamine--glycine ligase